MEYVLLDMKWSLLVSNKQLDFDVKQVAAIHIDENLHTVSTFHCISDKDSIMSKRIAYLVDSSDDVIMEMECAWDEFRRWLPDDFIFLVWNSEIERVWNRCNKMYDKKMTRAKVIDLQKLQEAMLPMKVGKKPLEGVMNKLGLICESTNVISSLYSVQCMLRLYRKMWKEGLKHLTACEWETILLSGQYDDLTEIDFFPEILSKQILKEWRSALFSFCDERGFVLHTKGTCVEIKTFRATWKFDMRNKGTDLQYIPKRYVQVPRYDMKIEAKSEDMMSIMQEIFEKIILIEDKLKYGVGNTVIESLIVKLGEDLVGSN